VYALADFYKKPS